MVVACTGRAASAGIKIDLVICVLLARDSGDRDRGDGAWDVQPPTMIRYIV